MEQIGGLGNEQNRRTTLDNQAAQDAINVLSQELGAARIDATNAKIQLAATQRQLAEAQKKIDELHAFEDELQSTDDKMLQRLIAIRHYLWT